jgi:hypothetical protein
MGEKISTTVDTVRSSAVALLGELAAQATRLAQRLHTDPAAEPRAVAALLVEVEVQLRKLTRLEARLGEAQE